MARANGVGVIDPASFTASQGFLYGGTPGNDYRVITSEGNFIDLLDTLDARAIGRAGTGHPAPALRYDTPEVTEITSKTMAEVESALTYIDPNCSRADWLAVLAALRSTEEAGRDEAHEMCHAWSAPGSTYCPEALDKAWASLDMPRTTYKAILRRAMDAGWSNPGTRARMTEAEIYEMFDDLTLITAISDKPETGTALRVAKPLRYKPLYRDDVHALPELRWLVQGVLPTTGLVAGFGPSGSGKSFLFYDLAAAIADGSPWFGHRVRQAPVVYLVLEGDAGLRLRTAAWELGKGRELPDAMAFIVQPFTLTAPSDIADMAAVVPGGSVVFIDTLNRAAPTADENSSQDMGTILEGAKALQRRCKGLVMLIHHTGKQAERGMRGHSSLFAALDASIEVTREGDRRGWQIAKSKDGQDSRQHAFTLETLVLHEDEHGDPVTSCVVRKGGGDAKALPKLTPQAEAALVALRDCIAAEGTEPTPNAKKHITGNVVPMASWLRATLADLGATGTPGAQRKVFERARDALIAANLVHKHGAYVGLSIT